MAKSRAQRQAEAAKRRALQQEGRQPIESDSEAQHDTQVPESAAGRSQRRSGAQP